MSTTSISDLAEHGPLLSREIRESLTATLEAHVQFVTSALAAENRAADSVRPLIFLDSAVWLALAERELARPDEWSLTTSHANYKALVEEVFSLRDEPEYENEIRVRPYNAAMIAAFQSLYKAYGYWTNFPTSVASARVFPLGDSIPYDDGGLRIEWRAGPRRYVRLLVSADGTSRVYFEFDADYGIDRNSDTLGRWLQRL